MTENPKGPDFKHKFIAARSEEFDYTLLLLHGTGGSETDLLPLAERLLPEAAIISPRGRVNENGMARFFRRIEPGVFDTEDLIKRTNELADFLKIAAEEYHFNHDKLVAVGYSNGANIAASLLLLRPETLRAAILFRPMVPLCPVKRPNLDGVNVLVCSGKHDEIIAPEESFRLAEMLHESCATVSLHWSGSGHGLSTADLEAAQKWVDAKLKNGTL